MLYSYIRGMKYLIITVIVVILISSVVHFRAQSLLSSPLQAQFITGIVPEELPDGVYKGSTGGYTASWIGKTFHRDDAIGANVFHGASEDVDKYPFKMYVGQGIQDKNTQVIKIDYNIPENPFWFRPVLDEIVQVGPDEYLGKAHIRLAFFPLTVTFFKLKK